MIDRKKLKVLHLARWYPNKFDPMPGLFIQRHIEAANIYCECGVVYTHLVRKDWDSVSSFVTEISMINGVPTAKVYYKGANRYLGPLGKIINIYRFYKANRIGIGVIKSELEGIDLLHIHILTRLGLIGLYYKLTKGIPYIVTEHWSRYLDVTSGFKGVFRKFITRVVVRYASAVTAVTKNLADSMQMHGLKNLNYLILPNVVDNVFVKYNPKKKENNKVNFLHVSCFEDKSKNISGLLRVIKELSLERDDFIFTMVGEGIDMVDMVQYSKKLGIDEAKLRFTGLLEGKNLVDEMNNADMLVIFSHYENFPVVINESLSLGVPVIATRVGGIPERVNKRNGILVKPGDESQLLYELGAYLNGKRKFNIRNIHKEFAKEFSADRIGVKLNEMYDKAIND